MKYRLIASVLIISTFVGITLYDGQINAVETYFFEIELVTNGGGVRPDYCLLIAQQLREIGIKVNVKVLEWTVYVGILITTHDFEMNVIGLSGGGASPDLRDIYSEEGSLNMFGIDTIMPYGSESEQMQIEGVTITDLALRQQHYYDWQQLMMDKIIPLVPLFSPRLYVATWSNLNGYSYPWGTVDSLPYMEFDGLHIGQDSLTEFKIADANWRDLNPLHSDDTSSSFVHSLMTEPIVGWSPDLIPLKTSLVTDWEQIDEFHYKFSMRDGVYWNPSFNVTARDAGSNPLDPLTTPLMEGLKAAEVSDGTNQQVTAKDAVFTYLAWANQIVSESTSYHDWISDCYVDPVDPLAFHIEIDGNPGTPEIEHYVDFWERLPYEMLPEFFLNSSSSEISYTSGNVQCTGLYYGILETDPWVYYSTSAFGCGKYMLDYFIRDSITVLQASPYWMGIGAIDGTVQDLDIGTVKIRVIPDINTQLTEFQAGYIDLMYMTSFPEERRLMQADSKFEVQSILTASFTFLSFNLQKEKIGGTNNYIFLTEPGKEEYTVGLAIRKAISYAINRVDINEKVHSGEYLISNSPIYPITAFYYYNDIIKYDFNLDLAWEWMEAAGYSQSDLTTALTFTSYDDPVETTTVTTTNYTETVFVTNVTTITIPADPADSRDPTDSIDSTDSTDATNPTNIVSFPFVPILTLTIMLSVLIAVKIIYKRKKK